MPELINIKLPPEVAKLAERLNSGLDTALELTFWAGLERGATWGFIAGLVVAGALFLLWRKGNK